MIDVNPFLSIELWNFYDECLLAKPWWNYGRLRSGNVEVMVVIFIWSFTATTCTRAFEICKMFRQVRAVYLWTFVTFIPNHYGLIFIYMKVPRFPLLVHPSWTCIEYCKFQSTSSIEGRLFGSLLRQLMAIWIVVFSESNAKEPWIEASITPRNFNTSAKPLSNCHSK